VRAFLNVRLAIPSRGMDASRENSASVRVAAGWGGCRRGTLGQAATGDARTDTFPGER
jgi:hypothetical protein